MRPFKFKLSIFLSLFLFVIAYGCKKSDLKNKEVLEKLYEIYQNGEITECKYNGQIVYTAGLNVYDAGSVIYDQDGKRIANCNYSWQKPEAICGQLSDCETVYRVEDNIWGLPGVNKYRLSK